MAGPFKLASLIFLLAGCVSMPVAFAQGDLPGPRSTLIIALDGANWRVAQPLVDSGRMPNLERLMNAGVYGDLVSLHKMASPNIWTTIATGKLPDKHGIFFFTTLLPDGTKAPVTSNLRKVNAVWNIFSRYKRKVGVIGYWATWPAEKVNGVIVSDHFAFTRFNRMGSSEYREGQTYPPELIDSVAGKLIEPSAVTDKDMKPFFSSKIPDKGRSSEHNRSWEFQHTFAADHTYLGIADQLLKKERYDLFIVYISGVDITSHYYWKYFYPKELDVSRPQNRFYRATDEEIRIYGRVIPEYYCHVDKMIGNLLSYYDLAQDAVFVISDHGFKAAGRFGVPTISGEHQKDGMYVVAGRGFGDTGTGPSTWCANVTPTLLRAYDYPVGRDMDGSVQEIWLSDEVLKRSTKWIDTHDFDKVRTKEKIMINPIKPEILEKLRSLGYIE